ncbi:MAG: aspartate aminotransferase family protein [Gammaproteobacteria bacterium]|nr:aspartate aminotransferase family protein [Gammaproteobacteria bacterium]
MAGNAVPQSPHIAALLARRERLLGPDTPLFYDRPLHLVRGEGVWLWDHEGRRYLDVYNNVPSVGHCHPEVVAALARQAAVLNVHSRYLDETVLDYAESLLATFDASLSTATFTCTGSEANDVALQMARATTGASGILCTDATYHGNTAAVSQLASIFTPVGGYQPHVRRIPAPDSYRALGGLTGAALRDAYVARVEEAIAGLQRDGFGVAAMLVCPIFANEGLPDVPAGFMDAAVRAVRAAGGLFIADEVQSGFARTGDHLWGYPQTGTVPDIVTLGKPMGNGHPIGAVIARREHLAAYRRQFSYFNTFGGNPVSAAVGHAVLRVIEREGLLQNACEVGRYLRDGLRRLAGRHAVMGDVRGSGLFIGVELVSNRAQRTAAPRAARAVVNALRDRGILISRIGVHDNVLKLRPPLVFRREHADRVLTELDGALAELRDLA